MKTQLEQYQPTTEDERLEKAQLTFIYEAAIDCGIEFTENETRKLNARIKKLLNIL